MSSLPKEFRFKYLPSKCSVKTSVKRGRVTHERYVYILVKARVNNVDFPPSTLFSLEIKFHKWKGIGVFQKASLFQSVVNLPLAMLSLREPHQLKKSQSNYAHIHDQPRGGHHIPTISTRSARAYRIERNKGFPFPKSRDERGGHPSNSSFNNEPVLLEDFSN